MRWLRRLLGRCPFCAHKHKVGHLCLFIDHYQDEPVLCLCQRWGLED